MDYVEFAKGYNSTQESKEALTKVIFKAFVDNIDEISFSEKMKGHQMNIYSDFDIKEKEYILKRFVENLVSDIEHQASMLSYIPENMKEQMQSELIDIELVTKGSFSWTPTMIYKPDMSVLTCQADGKKYIPEMSEWNITMYDYKTFLFNRTKEEIEPFLYNNAPILSKVTFPTGNLLAFNYLPHEIDDYIQNLTEKSLHSYQGRNWQKFLCELYSSVGIARTPTHIGGEIMQSNNDIILGGTRSDVIIEGDFQTFDAIDTDVWQSLVTDKQTLNTLFRLAFNISKSDADKKIEDMKEDQTIQTLDIAPGVYNTLTVPEMNDGDSKDMQEVYGILPIEGYETMNPDIIISQSDFSVGLHVDNNNIFSEHERRSIKKKIDNDLYELDRNKETNFTHNHFGFM